MNVFVGGEEKGKRWEDARGGNVDDLGHSRHTNIRILGSIGGQNCVHINGER